MWREEDLDLIGKWGKGNQERRGLGGEVEGDRAQKRGGEGRRG